jgi:ABC-type dipeptide/oligopeptide/nickel transport system ATPase component
LISAFYTADYNAYDAEVDDPYEQTCKWLEDCSEFKIWSTTTQGVLYVVGEPGTGKSVLAKYLLKTLCSDNQPPKHVIHFFCDAGRADSRDPGKQPTAVYALRNLIHQCLIHTSEDDAKSSYTQHVKKAKNVWGEGLLDSQTQLITHSPTLGVESQLRLNSTHNSMTKLNGAI